MSEAVMGSTQGGGLAHRARTARVGAGAAVLAMAVVVYGAYGDARASDGQKSAVPVLLGLVVVAAAIVYGWLAPAALRAVERGAASARRWAVGLTIASVLSIAVFWSGLPLLLGGAAALVGRDGRARSGASGAFGVATWLGAGAAAVAIVVTIVGNTVAGH
jgi:hypothetical protein